MVALFIGFVVMGFCAYTIMRTVREMQEEELAKIEWGSNESDIYGKSQRDNGREGRN